MAVRYQKHFNTRVTAQKDPIPGKDMVQNSAGGYSFEVDEWVKLERFLVLGTEGGSYYASERNMTKNSAENVINCIAKDGMRVVDTVVEISDKGRAPKNDPALFVLAMCAGMGDKEVRQYALANLQKVARIGTHLFNFMEYVKAFRGRGRALRTAVADWYQTKDADKLAYQVVKYQQRDGWSHKDILRLVKPKPQDAAHDLIYGWIAKGKLKRKGRKDMPKILDGHVKAQKAKSASEVVKIIQEYGITRESVPTEYLKDPKIMEALLYAGKHGMPITALIRNLGNLSKCGLVKPMSDASKYVIEKLTNVETLKRGRVHPLGLLVALNTYNRGAGVRGSGTWTVDQDVVDALDEAFYLAFDAVVPANKRFVLGLDVSGSMSWNEISGMPGITPRIGAAAMAMVTLKTEKQCATMAFGHDFVKVDLSRKKRLDSVCSELDKVRMGGTDCSLPMVWAMKNKVETDAFVVYTDSETWAGNIQPVQALQQYRDKMGIPAKLIVVGMEGNNFTIADPNDAGMMDVVGFNTTAPSVMADFVRE